MAATGDQDHSNLSKSLGNVHSRIDEHDDKITRLERLMRMSIALTVLFGLINIFLKIRG